MFLYDDFNSQQGGGEAIQAYTAMCEQIIAP